MHKIKLVADKPFHNNCDITVFDVTGEKEKKRCKIKLDYAESDIRRMQSEGYDYRATLKYFDDWIYNTVRLYIADDWECESGMEIVKGILEGHIKKYFLEEYEGR